MAKRKNPSTIRRVGKKLKQNHILGALALVFIVGGIFAIWVATLRIPALEDLSERKVAQSTKIYDRTGEVLLYDMSKDVRRELIPFNQISPYAVDAAIAIEDRDFYDHNGFKLSSFLRAVWVNLTTVSFSQGGSTITQQVVKNSILTKDKTPTRKLKELILALKLEKVISKQDILTLYLNEIPYGGNVYGIEEAAQNFFGKPAIDLTLAESAYLASLPKAPSYYSPYGLHREELEARKNLVLREMLGNGFISEEEFEEAHQAEVDFRTRENTSSIRAPHFVFFVIDHLAKQYGEEALQNSGFKIITTLDYDIQEEAERVAKKYGEINTKNFNGTNNGVVAIDPKNGDILAMVGSKDYFSDEIDGNFNITTAHRQPGSTFKPFVYSTMFDKGYTDSTILFDVPTQFSARCAASNFTSEDDCYSPGNYDDKFRGPMTIRSALAQSVNVPAVKGLYLAGVADSMETAKKMGIESLSDPDRYGLTLVLGGGEVSLLDMVSAYSVFANDGIRNPYNPILWIEDNGGNIIDRYTPFPRRVLNEQTSRLMSDILSDNAARSPSYGTNSPLYVAGRDVAVKTGTSNDYRDTWIIGYSPNIALGAWVGNNDNTPMEKKVAGLIVAPMWREIMDSILPNIPNEYFIEPEPRNLSSLKPILAGDWQSGGAHSILHWVDKDNPQGPAPSNPNRDPQYSNWEYSVSRWFANNYSPQPFYNPGIQYPYPIPVPFLPTTPLIPTQVQ